MTRLFFFFIVLKGHIQLLAYILQPAKKEIWHGNLPSVKYAPCTKRRSENWIMMIKVRHKDCQLYACAKRAQSDVMEGIYCKK